MAEVRRRQKPTDPSTSRKSGSAATSPEKGSSLFGWLKTFITCFLVVAGFLIALRVIGNLSSSIDPVPVSFPSLEGFTKKHHVDESSLTKVKHLFRNELPNAQTIAVDGKGNLYAGLNDGQIIQFTPKTFKFIARLGKPPYNLCSDPRTQHTCGVISGISFNPNNSSVLYISDAYHGILRLDLQEKAKMSAVVDTTLPISEDIPPMRLITDLTVLSNGSIFFTDGSSKFGANESTYELFEARDNGKLMHYNPADKSIQMVVSNLHFPTGVCASHNEDFLVISETTRARILKYYLKGPSAGKTEVLAENLPGLPWKITRSAQNSFWVGFGISRLGKRLDEFYKNANRRALFINLGLTSYLASKHIPEGLLVLLNEEGAIVRCLYDHDAEVIGDISEVLEVGSSLYLTSKTSPFVGLLENLRP